MTRHRDELRARYAQVFAQPLWRRFLPVVVAVLTLGYLVYAAWFFALPQVFGGARWDRAGDMLAQWISYDATVEFRLNEPDIVPRYPRFSPLGNSPDPDWIRTDGQGGYVVTLASADAKIAFSREGITLTHSGETRQVTRGTTPSVDGPLPSWMSIREDEVRADFGFFGDLRISPERIKLRHRFLGWANFVFDINSPFFGKSSGEVIGLMFSPEELVPGKSNLALALDNFLNNAGWQHGDVLIKLLQTVIMALVGTFFAACIALPLAFFAARNITPNRTANALVKRMFDFLRSADMLIWALFFTRAFGPGPLAGIGAIFLTETGLLGKVYAEGFENIDPREPEGVKSTGASPVLVQRYGVVPQVMPLIISQTLYQWESNTRSATIIGAVGAGGIGLKLWEAMRTNSNWANVFYMVLLILLVVYVLDFVSGKLRSRLIDGDIAR